MTKKLGYNAKDGLECVNSVNIIEDLDSSHSYFPSFPRQLILARYGSCTGSGMNLILLESKDDHNNTWKTNWLMTIDRGLC